MAGQRVIDAVSTSVFPIHSGAEQTFFRSGVEWREQIFRFELAPVFARMIPKLWKFSS